MVERPVGEGNHADPAPARITDLLDFLFCNTQLITSKKIVNQSSQIVQQSIDNSLSKKTAIKTLNRKEITRREANWHEGKKGYDKNISGKKNIITCTATFRFNHFITLNI